MPDIPLEGAVLSAANDFTKDIEGGFVLHPNQPGQDGPEPASVRFPDLDLHDKTGFSTTLSTSDRRCRPVLLRLEVDPGDGADAITLGEVRLAGSMERQWSIPFPELPPRADLVLTCRIDQPATDNLYSGVAVIGPALVTEPSSQRPASAQVAPSVGSDQRKSTPVAPDQRKSTQLLALLFDGRIAEYLQVAADARDCLWTLHHIAKTAGTSLLNEISAVLEPNLNVFGNPASQFPDVESALQHHLPTIRAGEIRFVTGHFNRYQVERICHDQPAPRPITFLRHPIDRYVSQYRYMLTPAEPTHQEIRRRYSTLAAYTEWNATHNVMFQLLRRSEDDTVDDVIRDLEHNYAFVGLTERYLLCRRVVFRLLGSAPPRRPLVENRTESIPENEIEWSRDIARLREINDKDLALYAHFAERFLGIERPLRHHLDAHCE